MPHDPELVAETRGWLQRATSDLGAGRNDLTADPPFTGDAAFHAQQAVEKSLKGFLTWHSRIFGKTHNLTELGGMCVDLDPALEPAVRGAAHLTDYAWKYRATLASRMSRHAPKPSRPSRLRGRCTTPSSPDCQKTITALASDLVCGSINP
ncbi:MAG TPA: HEPN domain-containing protein [Vicinamibacterales bacterium]|nr:HEPN domain-containing protein [Vicinamibacterales bacterium]